MTKSLDLTLSKKHDFSFFSDITKIKDDIKANKLRLNANGFTEKDKEEIQRGNSYAVFNELKASVSQGKMVTIESFKHSLASRGITDARLQNKILYMTLQTEMGIQYPLGNMVNTLFLENKYNLMMNSNYSLSMKVNSNRKVTVTLEGIVVDITTDLKEPEIAFTTSFTITPEEVALSEFKITQLSDSQTANDAYHFLKSHQQNIIEKIISYIKHFFGFHDELTLEKQEENDTAWASPSMT